LGGRFKGHLVVHSTRHSPIEFGKDVISIARDGVPCAFQLKGNPGSRLTLTQLRKITPQLLELATQPIIHPGVLSGRQHRCYLVTNGQVEEEVQRAIDDVNRGLENNGYGKNRIETWTRGHLFDMATRLGASLWPSELNDLNTFLAILVHRGDNLFPLDKIDRLLKRTLLLDEDDSIQFGPEIRRRITSAAVLVAVALRNFSVSENHYATISAWTFLIAYTIASCERHRVSYAEMGQSAVAIARDTIFDALAALCKDVKENPRLVTSGFEIAPIYQARATLIYALMSLYWLWSEEQGWPVKQDKEFLDGWLPKDHNQSYLWGEAAVPQYLIQYWYFSKVDATWRSEMWLGALLNAVIRLCIEQERQNFPSPYFTFEDFARHLLAGFLESGNDPLRGETTRCTSFMAEGVLGLFTRTNLKGAAKLLWENYTRLGIKRFDVEEPWQFCLYRTDAGKETTTLPAPTKEWDELVNEARDCKVPTVPFALAEEKWVLVLFILLVPYRATPDVLRYLGRKLGTVWCVPSAIEG
jgi:hypothetical protein